VVTGGAERHVRTVDIRMAVKGRETDILDKLGIGWRDGRPHIPCPYRDHADRNPSWRWDATKARAFCTCTKADNIFDVVVKVAGVDFHRAKIHVADLLGRNDLIRGSGKHQPTDAASLLNAPAENRDDNLPVAYLAHRLSVSQDVVPIPSTPMVGLKALGYFDAPPSGSKATPKLVGEFACAVFGTVAADGRTHAHRIYVAPGGAGKAELGTQPEGKRRNPKKSARLIGNDNIAGRSVRWGDPNRARQEIVTEGIETGAAVARALAEKIAAGEVVVAAAISATGVEAFEPNPTTECVTIAADRDEAPKADSRPGSRRGEGAARAFALKHYGRLKVAIALPGVSGQTTDWLDVLVEDGADAVRAGIMSAIPFVPTQAELDAAAQRTGRAAELNAIAVAYPCRRWTRWSWSTSIRPPAKSKSTRGLRPAAVSPPSSRSRHRSACRRGCDTSTRPMPTVFDASSRI
jgi:hypothetical protein